MPSGDSKYAETILKASGVNRHAVQSDFGAKYLEKFGWKHGEGIGKDSQGIKEPVQVRRRDDDLGIGAEEAKAAEWNTWWEDVYNESAAKNRNRGTVLKAKKPKKRISDMTGLELLALCRNRG